MSSEELKFDFNYEIIQDNYGSFDLIFKIIIVGDSAVGKSCITNRAIKNVFQEKNIPTIGFESMEFCVKIDEKIIKLQLWDTCGQEQYRSLITNFYRNSSLAIIVYSITDRSSFENIDTWYKDIRAYTNPDIKIFLIGNKLDLEEKRKVKKEEGENFVKEYNLNKFIEASAKSGFNAQNIFIEAAKLLYDEYISHKNNNNLQNNDEKLGIDNVSLQSKGASTIHNRKIKRHTCNC